MIEGKGFFVWQADKVIERMGVAGAGLAAQAARAAGIRHALVKIADGQGAFPIPKWDPTGQKESATRALINALKAEGITVWGWAFAYGPSVNDPLDAELQAVWFARRAWQFGLTGLVVNAEDFAQYKWTALNGYDYACRYMQRLRQEMAGASDLTIALSSYRYIRYHTDFPFAAFMESCDIAMPQVYWVARDSGDAAANLVGAYQDYRQYFPDKPFIPTGAAYGETQGTGADAFYWTASPLEITRFLDQAKQMGFPAVNFWSWEHALHDPGNAVYPNTELWDAVAAYGYGGGHTIGPVYETEIRLYTGQDGYYDGHDGDMPTATLTPFDWNGQTMKYALSRADRSSVWAAWVPQLPSAGDYEISVWVPGRKATTRGARYKIHGVVGHAQPVEVTIDQLAYSDAWVPLGTFKLDPAVPESGHVYLNDWTREDGRCVAFAGMRWRKQRQGGQGPGGDFADGFDAPVGTPAERRTARLWPGDWVDANGYAAWYGLYGTSTIHTGADFNLNVPAFDADRGAPVYAIGSGTVTFAGQRAGWGNVLVIRHDPYLAAGGQVVYSRYGHLDTITVSAGQRVARGDYVGTIGQDTRHGPFHLHFDISGTEVLLHSPGDWPSTDEARVRTDYLDPLEFIRDHRPAAG